LHALNDKVQYWRVGGGGGGGCTHKPSCGACLLMLPRTTRHTQATHYAQRQRGTPCVWLASGSVVRGQLRDDARLACNGAAGAIQRLQRHLWCAAMLSHVRIRAVPHRASCMCALLSPLSWVSAAARTMQHRLGVMWQCMLPRPWWYASTSEVVALSCGPATLQQWAAAVRHSVPQQPGGLAVEIMRAPAD
jgi:hypothetical protein